MYPNPQDVLPLSSPLDVEQYRTCARELLKCARADAAAIDEWAEQWVSVVARASSTHGKSSARDRAHVSRQLATFARERLRGNDATLAQAQRVIARAHGFSRWSRLVQHLGALTAGDTTASAFERAADAIVTGDAKLLDTLIGENRTLVQARSDREHQATLLHYVAANGVENFRQRTPRNIVAIATRLLDAGATVDATCDVYGGGATTLGLTATSAHPRGAGVQLALLDLLEARGAHVASGSVHSCLANGCPEAAAWYAKRLLARGDTLTLSEIAGIGLVDLLPAAFAHAAQNANALADALQHAAWYGHVSVLEWCIARGVPVDSPSPDGGDTILHQAAYLGNAPLVRTLLGWGASVHAVDRVYHTTPLVWALHGWLEENRSSDAAYRDIARQLVAAGAAVRMEWVDDARVRADAALYDALMERARGFCGVARTDSGRCHRPFGIVLDGTVVPVGVCRQ
jgi:hypothetical protein